MAPVSRGILVTGGGSFLGDNIASALLAAGASVSLLAHPAAEDKLGPLAQTTRWSLADVWQPASLRGKARFHSVVIHTVGSLRADPSRGLTHEWLNAVSARNVADMCVRDGVERIILLSSASAPWVSRSYIRSKRQAEAYLKRLGLSSAIIRAPLLYAPGSARPLFYRLLSLLGAVPLLSWRFLGRAAPMPIDVFARGVAMVALAEEALPPVLYASDLRRRAKIAATPGISRSLDDFLPASNEDASPFDSLEENLPFAWSPDDETG